MGASPISELLNQPHLKPAHPRDFTFSQVNTLLFYLNQLGSKFSGTFIQKNLDSYVDPWLGFCLTQLWGWRQTIKSVLSASAFQIFWAHRRATPHPQSPHLQLTTQFPITLWNPSRRLLYPISISVAMETITTVLTMWKTREVPCHSKQWLTTISRNLQTFHHS